jgi:hypothetical protein
MVRALLAIAVVVVGLATACDGPDRPADANEASAPHVTWSCPPGWVEGAVGGCGPAAVLCVADGGAAPDACNGFDAFESHPFADDDDGGVATPLYRAPDGRFAGGWHEPDEAAPYPPSDWTPDAGNGSSGDAWAPTVAFDSCPPGWIPTSDGACDPHLGTACDSNSGPLPADGCTATGAASCGPAPYVDPGPAAIGATIVHARSMADASSADGSEAHPFATLRDALAAAGAGGYVLVAAGRYDESVAITADVHILGACSANVVVASPAGESAFSVSGSARVDLRGLTIEGPGRGLAVTAGAVVSIDRVTFAHVADVAIAVQNPGTVMHAADVWVHDLAANSSTAAVALDVSGGALADGSRVSIQRVRQNAIVLRDAASAVTLSDSAIVTTAAGDPMQQATVSVTTGSLDLSRTVVRDNVGVGVSVVSGHASNQDDLFEHTVATTASGSALFAQQAQVDIDRLHVNDVQGGSGVYGLAADVVVRHALIENLRAFPNDPASGIGLELVAGDRNVANVRVRRAQEYGALFFSRADSPEVFMRDSIVEDVTLPSADAGGGGIVGYDVHSMHLDRVLVQNVPIVGIALTHGCEGDVRESVVRGVRDPSPSGTASGLFVYEGARLSASDVSISDIGGIGASVQTAGATLAMAHSYVGHVQATIVGTVAVSGGVLVADGAHANVRGVRIEDIPVFGFASYQSNEIDTVGEIADSAIVHIWAPVLGSIRPFAAACAALSGATATMRRTFVSDASPLGAIASDGATLFIRDSALRDTRTGAGGTASAALLGTGVGAIDASRTLVEGSQNTGIIAVARGHVAFRDGIVTNTLPDTFGFGTGISASGDGQVALERVALLDTRGAALMAAPYADPLTPRTVGATIRGTDVYVSRVARSTIRIEYDEAGNPQASTQEVSYATHAGAMCSVDLERAVLREAGFGFYDSSGTYTVRDGVIAAMVESAGAQSGSAPLLTHVGFVANASDAIVQRTDLPEGAMLPAPQPACSTPGCL